MVEKYLLTKPLVMTAVFVVFVVLPLLYEVVAYLRARPSEAPAPAAEEPVAPAKVARRRRRR